MSHVDDGILHALLDGALAAADPAEAERVELHVAACPDCRARLGDAARVREEAGALLASAQPRVVATPPFEAIRARAQTLEASAAPAARPRRSRADASWAAPFSGFAWAATVVLAVGLGWLLHDTVEEPARVAITDSAERDGAREDAALAPAEEAPIPPAPGLSDFPAGAGVGVGAEEGRAGGNAGERRVDPGAARSRTPEYAVTETDRPQGFQSLAPPPPPPPAVSQRADARGAEYNVAEEVAVGATSGLDLADAAAEAPPPAAAPAAAAPDDGWRQTTVAEAIRHAGEIVRLDDAQLVAAATRGSGSGLEVRTVQMTERGEMLTVVQRPLAADRLLRAQRSEAAREAAAAEAPEAESPMPAVTVQVDDWVVTISGPVARERLEQLAEGLR